MATVAIQTRAGAIRQLSIKQLEKRLQELTTRATLQPLQFTLGKPAELCPSGMTRAEVYFSIEGNTFVIRYVFEDGDLVSVPIVRLQDVAEALHHHRASEASKPKPVDPDFVNAQTLLGCAGCRFTDSEQLGRGPCCTLPRLNRVDAGNRCLDRQEPGQAAEPIPLNWQCEECGGDLRNTGWEHVLLVDRDTVVCPKCAKAIRRRTETADDLAERLLREGEELDRELDDQ
jgi:hypothetical protein